MTASNSAHICGNIYLKHLEYIKHLLTVTKRNYSYTFSLGKRLIISIGKGNAQAILTYIMHRLFYHAFNTNKEISPDRQIVDLGGVE